MPHRKASSCPRFIALGIGLHNLGEGLAVGAAIAAGEAALATFLVIGFTIHNVTEGFGIATPLIDRQPEPSGLRRSCRSRRPARRHRRLARRAGGEPALDGASAFGIGAGAILQVIIEMTALIARRDGQRALATPARLGGVIAGLAVMYLTALLV